MKISIRNSKQGVERMRSLWEKMKVALDNGVALTVEVQRENRSLEQNAMYHSIIHQIAKQAQHLGSTWDAESWKRLLVDAYTKEQWAFSSGPGDGIVQLGLQTRKFTKQQASEFTEWLIAWCAQNGVEIHE